MKKYTNSIMAALLEKYSEHPFLSVISRDLIAQNDSLRRALDPKFQVIDDMVFFADPEGSKSTRFVRETPFGDFQDRTGVEAFHNKVFIGDLLAKKEGLDTEIFLGGLLADAWSAALKKHFPREKFVIPWGSSFGEYPCVDIRFYKKRLGEVWLDYSTREKREATE
jgi:hypothetical protein